MYEYTTADIQILSLREHIRKRPGMYFGDMQGGRGVLHLLLEVLADAIDQSTHGRRARVDRLALTRRLEDLAALLPTLTLSWSFTGTSAGLVGRILTEVPDPLGGVLHHTGDIRLDDHNVHVDLAFAWPADRPRTRPQIHSFTNLQPTDSSRHLAGLQDAIHAFLPRQLRRTALEGLVAAIAVQLPDPNHGRQTMLRLATPSIRTAVDHAAAHALEVWSAAHPDAAAKLRTRP